jgi:hypothetical protein
MSHFDGTIAEAFYPPPFKVKCFWNRRDAEESAMNKEYFLVRFVLIMAAALVLAGCTAPQTTIPPVTTLPGPTPVTQPPAPSWHMIKNGTITIAQDTYHYFGWDVQSGQSVKFEVVTDGAPLDLAILDSRNFNNFQQNNESSEVLKRYIGFTVLQGVFTASYPDAFFFVFDNFNDPGGSYAGRDITVNVTFYSEY